MQHLQKWTRQDHYAGAEWSDYFVFLAQHRDSDTLTQSNFTCGLARLGGESDTVRVVRERHWAVGWVEWIAVHESDTVACQKADAMLADLVAYPALDEDHFSELEWFEAADYWGRLTVRERVDICRDAGVSIFAARRADLPQDDTGAILERLR